MANSLHYVRDKQPVLQSVRAMLRPGGRLFLLCFSDKEPGTQGPRRVSKKEIGDAFAEGWVKPDRPQTRTGFKVAVIGSGPAGLTAAGEGSADVVDGISVGDRKTPVYEAGSGWKSYGASLLGGVDLSGDARDGGWGMFGLVSYSRLTGDAKRSPVTSIRGDADQWFLAAGVSYTF